MKDFRNYLDSKQFSSKKTNHFYALWIKKLYKFFEKDPNSSLNNDDITHFINYLSKNNQDWQVKQAEEAIKLFTHYKNRNRKLSPPTDNLDEQWKSVADEMVNMLRLKQRALDTEKSYMYWLRQFYRFLTWIPDLL